MPRHLFAIEDAGHKMDTLLIRNATPADATSLKKLLAELGYPGLTAHQIEDKVNHYSKDPYRIFVGQLNNEVIGLICLHWYDTFFSLPPVGRIIALAVLPGHQSKGAGKQLLFKAEQFLSSMGCRTIEITSNNRREHAHAFYIKQNYELTSSKFKKEIS